MMLCGLLGVLALVHKLDARQVLANGADIEEQEGGTNQEPVQESTPPTSVAPSHDPQGDAQTAESGQNHMPDKQVMVRKSINKNKALVINDVYEQN